MKKEVLLSLAGIACLLAGFGLFLAKQKGVALAFTLAGIFVYLYKLKKNRESEN